MLLRVTDCRVRSWRQNKSGFAPKHVQAALQGGGGSVENCVALKMHLTKNSHLHLLGEREDATLQ